MIEGTSLGSRKVAIALLFALGSYKPTVYDVMTVVAGVLMFAIAGEFLRQLRLKVKSLKP